MCWWICRETSSAAADEPDPAGHKDEASTIVGPAVRTGVVAAIGVASGGDHVGGRVVLVVAPLRFQLIGQGQESGFGIARRVPAGLVEGLEIPVAVAIEAAEIERIFGPGREHHTVSRRVLDHEGLAAATSPDFELLVAGHPLVVIGIEGEQHPDVAPGIGTKDYEISVLGGSNVDLGPVTVGEFAVLIVPDL